MLLFSKKISVDEDGNSIMEKRNGSKSDVYGGTFEARWNYNQRLQVESGITLQKSLYGEPVQWSGQLPGVKEYLRTPDSYGYFTMRFMPRGPFEASLSGIYTGTMKIPHYGVSWRSRKLPKPMNCSILPLPGISIPNFRTGLISHGLIRALNFLGVFPICSTITRTISTKGKNRDSGFVYGPAKPRTIFFGIRLFN
jgi:outer membrane receptor for ferrienterochelin and colicins